MQESRRKKIKRIRHKLHKKTATRQNRVKRDAERREIKKKCVWLTTDCFLLFCQSVSPCSPLPVDILLVHYQNCQTDPLVHPCKLELLINLFD